MDCTPCELAAVLHCLTPPLATALLGLLHDHTTQYIAQLAFCAGRA